MDPRSNRKQQLKSSTTSSKPETGRPAKTKRKVQDEEDNASEASHEDAEESVDESVGEPAGATNAPMDDSEEAQLFSRLVWAVYETRPSKLQRRVLAYIVQMRKAPAPHADDYIAFVRATYPSVKASAVAKEWGTIKQFFSGDDQEQYSTIAGLANVPELVAAFKVAPTLDAQMVEIACMPPPVAVPRPTSSSSSSASSGLTPRGRSRSNSNSNSGSNSNGNSSAKHLSPTQVALMQALFKVNFDQFQGKEWLLPSGAIFDRVLYETIKDVRYECPLHSFVLENPAAVLGLFPDARDQDELKKVLVDRADEKLPVLSSAEKALLEIYNKDPEELEELLAEKGWRAVGASLAEKPSADFQRLVYECVQQLLKVYRGERMAIPQAPHESWMVNRLWGFLADALHSPQLVEFQPGEYHSQASMHRRNLGRPRDVRQFVGHKVDGVAIAAIKKLELLVIEAAKKDEGPNVTKALDDGMKLCKLTKDMHDLIRGKAKHNVREHLVTFGIQISGETATFFTLRQRRGRFYQLCREGSETLPSVWADQVGTQCVLEVLMKVLIIRKALLSMAKDVAACTIGSIGGSDPVDSDADWVPATITSPQLIPSSPPLSTGQPHKLRFESDFEPEKVVYYSSRGFDGHGDTESPFLVDDDELGPSTPSARSNGKRSTATRASFDATESTTARAEFIRPTVPEYNPYRLPVPYGPASAYQPAYGPAPSANHSSYMPAHSAYHTSYGSASSANQHAYVQSSPARSVYQPSSERAFSGSPSSSSSSSYVWPTALQALKLVPIRKILFGPSGSTDSDTLLIDTKRIPTNADIECTDPDPLSAEDTEPIDNDAENPLRSNSSALFCFEKGSDKYYCKILKEVDSATTVCNNGQRTASGRRKHLMRKHPAILADIEYFQERQQRASLILENLKQDALPPTPSKSKRSKTAHILNTNTGTAFEWSETQQQSAEHQLMKLISMDGLPFHVAISANLKEFCRILNPQVDHDGRLDMFDQQEKYLGVTFLYMTREYRISSVVIGMEHLTESKITALVLTSVIMVSYEQGCGHDQGANIMKGLQECEQNTGAYWVACTAHKMQLCINKAWSESNPLVEITNRCVAIVSFFNNSAAKKVFNGKWGKYLIAARRADGVSLLAQVPTLDAVSPTPADAQLPSDDVESIANPQPSVPSFRSLRYKQGEVTFVSANATRWNSKLAMISRFLDISPVLRTTFEVLFPLDKISAEERAKFKTIEKLLPTDDELDLLKETDQLLTPAANFTHWIGGSGYSTISQACIQAHGVLSNPAQFKTGAAILLYEKLKTHIEYTWSLDDIPDGMLLAMYLNPACATSTIWDLDNSRQVAERDAQIAAEEAAASLADPALGLAQNSRPDIAGLPFKLPLKYRLRISVEGPFTLPVDFPLQLPQTDAKTPPTNRLRADTLAYMELIRHYAYKEIEGRSNHGTSKRRGQADDFAVIQDRAVSALCGLISYRSILNPTNADSNKKYFKDPLAKPFVKAPQFE
ncbi:hypothetical protein KI688_005351 [Linnemannia hyalina]|uniref:Uncharacterized protein n=1 Tax=Linnemannia hyalina TaxID=64524 RepID=A0A9P7XJY5_9FUNG|nr:hypothetical protein KI688_005351 [Linnemannia hyalina]